MSEERKLNGHKHSVSLQEREQVTVTGVLDVLSFDEEGIVMDTEQGMLIVRGTSLHVGKLNLDDGEVCVDGAIDSLEYNEGGQFAKGKGSFLGKIFK